MILTLNYFIGILIRLISWIIIQFHPNLKAKFFFVKNQIINSEKNNRAISVFLINSLIEIEDKRFYLHLGIDFYSITRAFINNFTKNRFEGASTIDQQLVRCITNERTLKIGRKIREIIVASLIDSEFSKTEILVAYFHHYKFKNCNGVFELCKKLDFDIEQLSICESAQIAARFKYPTINQQNYIQYLKRVRIIEIRIERILKTN